MSPPRNDAVDAFRLLAVFGVVVVHMAPSTAAAGAFTEAFHLFAVPYFLLISLYFYIQRIGKLPVVRLSDLRLDRILVPYAAWTLIYTVMRLLKLRFEHRALSFDVLGVIFFGGGAVQLYFLPMLLLFQTMALAMILLFRAPRDRLAGVMIGLGAVAFACAGAAGNFFGFQTALKSGVVYVAMAFLLKYLQARVIGRQINVVVGWLVVGFILSTAYLGRSLIPVDVITQLFIAGYGVAALALNTRFRLSSPVIRTALTCSYGIYLAHLVFLESFEIATKKSGWMLTPYSVVAKVVTAGMICLCCVLLILTARRYRWSAYFLFGEGREAARPGVISVDAHPAGGGLQPL